MPDSIHKIVGRTRAAKRRFPFSFGHAYSYTSFYFFGLLEWRNCHNDP